MLFEVYEENWETLECFLALQSQWRIVSIGLAGARFQGLDYACITPHRFWLLGVPRSRQRDVFAGLRVMERAALVVLNEPKESADG